MNTVKKHLPGKSWKEFAKRTRAMCEKQAEIEAVVGERLLKVVEARVEAYKANVSQTDKEKETKKIMRVKDVVNKADYKGVVDTLVNPLLKKDKDGGYARVFLNSSETGNNLVPVVMNEDGSVDFDALLGTPLSPAEWIQTEHGVIPGPLFHVREVKIKAGYEVDGEGELGEGTWYWDFPILVTNMHFYALESSDANWSRVVDGAAESLYKVLTDEVYDHHSGAEVRAVQVFDPRVQGDEIFVPLPIADMYLDALAKTGVKGVPTTYEQLCGMWMQVRRYPIQDEEGAQMKRIRVIRDWVLAFRRDDKTAKDQGGDWDGDQTPGTPEQMYLGSLEMFGDMGSLEMVDALEDPLWLDTPTFTLSSVGARKWPDNVSSTAGMGTKALQGVLTNGFDQLGTAANIVFHEAPDVLDSIIRDYAPCTSTTQLINRFRSGLGCATEICLDFRKAWTDALGVEHANGEYAQELWALINAFSMGTLLPESVGNVDKGGKKINAKEVNTVLTFVKEALYVFLSRYPVQGTVTGDIDIMSAKGKETIARLAHVIAQEGLPQFLRYACGYDIEQALPPIKDAREINEDAPCIRIGNPATEPAWNFRDGELDIEYIQRRAKWAGGDVKVSRPRKDRGRWLVTLNGGVMVHLSPTEFKPVAPSDDSRVGFVRVTRGQQELASRLILRSLNACFGASPEVDQVQLVTLPCLIAEYLADQDLEIARRRAKAEGKKKPFDAKAEGKRVERELEKMVAAYTRAKGQQEEGLQIIEGEINLSSVQAAIVRCEGNTPEQTMARNQALLQAIHEGEFSNPLNFDVFNRFDVGYGSKNKPGTICTVLPSSVKRVRADGTTGAFKPSRPVIAYCVNVWLDSDRQMRETLSVRMACELVSPESILVTNGMEALMPKITQRRRDGVWVAVAGKGWMFSDVKLNGDMGRLTPHGMSMLKRRPRREMVGPVTFDQADMIAEQRLGPGKRYEDLIAAGWTAVKAPRHLGRWDSVSISEAYFTLVSPLPMQDPTWNKCYVAGHKFIAVPTAKDYTVEVNGEMVPVMGFIPIESMIQKKMVGSMCAGLSVFLGRKTFGLLGECLIHPDRKAGDDVMKYDDIVKDCATRLASKGLDENGMLPVVNEDGVTLGSGLPMVLPTFVLKEDDKISTGSKSDGCANSLATLRALGSTLTVDGHRDTRIQQADTIQALSQFVDSRGRITLDGYTILEAQPTVEEEEDNVEYECEDDHYVPDFIPAEEESYPVL